MQDEKLDEGKRYKGQWARFLDKKLSEKQLDKSFKYGWIEMDKILNTIYKKD